MTCFTPKQLKEFAKLNFDSGIEFAHNEELRFLRKLRESSFLYHVGKNCDCLICKKIKEFESE
jgi:hypothetical protein